MIKALCIKSVPTGSMLTEPLYYFKKDKIYNSSPRSDNMFIDEENKDHGVGDYSSDWFLKHFELIVEKSSVVEEIELAYPGMTTAFKEQQRAQYELFCSKQKDYGPGNISLGTALENEQDIQNSLRGLWFRYNDKVQRLKNFILTNMTPENESIEDSWIDMSNYANISLLVKNGKWGK